MAEKELLEEQLEKLEKTTVSNLDDWRSETLPIIVEIFGEKSSQYGQFNTVGWYSMQGHTSEHINEFKNCLKGFIKCVSLRQEKQQKSSHSNKHQNQIVINNNPNFSQSQSQHQTQSQNIEDIIKDEIPPSRMREIEEILKTEEPEKTKLEKVGDVLQKVGIGVTSSVLARIITSSMGIF
ncbi:TPA: hypothetical protein IAA68_07515 [Candidatus Galligastranaerophilus faecipullorum]|nr:hypothetical protein [Candidatus Galligastranaerophilus faecipullorum]